jgi:multisubunit Na+/H+ antiporter MnhF subunit
MNVAGNIAVVMLFVATTVASARALRRGSLADRAVAMEALTPILTCGLLCAVAITGDSLFLDLTLVLGLLSFLTTITVARYIERRGT